MIVATPAAGLEAAHLLAGSLAASDGEHLQTLAFDGAFEMPDAWGGRRETVGELQIGHEVDDLFLGQSFQEPLRHERHRQGLALLDLALGNHELRAAGHDKTERLRVLELDDAAHGRATLELKDVELIVLTDDAVGVEHVLEEVIQLTDIRASEAGPDQITNGAESMADATG